MTADRTAEAHHHGGEVDPPRVDVVDAAHVARASWRNGGGTTRTLWAEPPTDRWDWRLSVADLVDDEAAFSHLPGVRRTLVPLDGAVELVLDGRRQHVPVRHPVGFDGALAATARPLHGPTQVLNVMTRDARRARVSTQQLDGDAVWDPDVRAVVVLSGTLELAGRRVTALQAAVWAAGRPPVAATGHALVTTVRIHPPSSEER